MNKTLYKVIYKRKPKSKPRTEYFDNFALALSRVSALRHDNCDEIILSDIHVTGMNILVHYTLDNAISRYIEVLGIDSETITFDVVIEAYRNKMKEVHPDVGGTTDEVISVKEARDNLINIIMSSGNITNE